MRISVGYSRKVNDGWVNLIIETPRKGRANKRWYLGWNWKDRRWAGGRELTTFRKVEGSLYARLTEHFSLHSKEIADAVLLLDWSCGKVLGEMSEPEPSDAELERARRAIERVDRNRSCTVDPLS